jgi:AAA+ superfamily predicted ATPase
MSLVHMVCDIPKAAFRGPAGTGKTEIAKFLLNDSLSTKKKRPVSLF